MKTIVELPDREIEDAMRFTETKTAREAIEGAVFGYNRRMRMAALVRHAGTCKHLYTPEELRAMSQED